MSEQPQSKVVSQIVQETKVEEKKQKKEKKPNDQWKKKAEQKKLKKLKDQQMEKNKKITKEAENQESKVEKKANQRKNKGKQLAQNNASPQIKKTESAIQTKTKQANVMKTKASSIQDILPTRNVEFRTRQIDSNSILLSYTPQIIHENDSTLLGSTHQIIKDWNDMNIGQVIDIWGISLKSNRKQNVIRTRLQDIPYFSKTITKVVVGASAVFQNGAIMSTPGTLFLALLAFEYNIPFIVLGSSHKYYDVAVLEGDYSQYEGEICDIIPAKYISLMVTEAGPINICSIQTLVKQLHSLK